MKIGEASNLFPEFPQQKKVKDKGAVETAKTASGKKEIEFKESMAQAAESRIRGSLDELMAGLQAQGERLARSQTFEELTRYKKLVRAFMDKASHDLYRLQDPQLVSGSGHPQEGGKVHVILQKVDLEMEKLTKMVLGGQIPQLRILEKLDQIKGLLLDAYQ